MEFLQLEQAPDAQQGPEEAPTSSAREELLSRVRSLVQSFGALPDIYQRRRVGAPEVQQELGVYVYAWEELKMRQADFVHAGGGASMFGGGSGAPQHGQPATFVPTQPPMLPQQLSMGGAEALLERVAGARQSLRAAKPGSKASKGGGSGRTYTSKYRGVHQTFPTRRWEAQFRRSGKPTSLGCFDHEEEAARAYDKMMLWCELHNAGGVKGGITNFDPTEYEADIPWLQQVTQDELVQLLRSDGRRQAAQRMLKQKRDGQAGTRRGSREAGGSPDLSD